MDAVSAGIDSDVDGVDIPDGLEPDDEGYCDGEVESVDFSNMFVLLWL